MLLLAACLVFSVGVLAYSPPLGALPANPAQHGITWVRPVLLLAALIGLQVILFLLFKRGRKR